MIQRRIKIPLDEFDSTWKDCYVLVSTCSFKENIEYQKEGTKLERKIDRNQREQKKVTRSLDIEDTQELRDREDKLNDEYIALGVALTEIAKNLVMSHFVSGNIYDSELKAVRPLVKEDIESLDVDVIKKISATIQGNISKKN